MTGNPKDSPWYATPTASRKRKPLTLTLSDGARERLEGLAASRGESLSATVERLILAERRKPAPKKRTK